MTAAPVPTRQHWSDVLGVPRDCSTREATRAYRTELAVLNDRLTEHNDPEAAAAIVRLKDAFSACCREHEVQVEE